jgi:Uncharacterized protein conserved in bacteria
MKEEPHQQRLLRFARIRRAKFWLRFMPRRARFHTYPVVGRFAGFARKRSYLWSFRYSSLRSSFYIGPILSLMPVMGVQLPIAFLLCLVLRTNFMVAGGLQFITNPVTAGPVYYGTYKLGMQVIKISGFGHGLEPAPASDFQPTVPPSDDDPESALLHDPKTGRAGWTSRIGTGINALILGGLIAGTFLGGLLDFFWRRLVLPAARHHAAKKPVTAVVTPHDHSPPPSDTPRS